MPINTTPTFTIAGSGDGIVTTDIRGSQDYGRSVVVLANGNILVAGDSNNGSIFVSGSDFSLVRYNSNGSVDATFNQDGIVTTDSVLSDDYCFGLTIQADEKILLAGFSNTNDGNTNFALVRYNSDGSIDTTFSADDIPNPDARGYSVIVNNDGKILMAGNSNVAGNYDFTLVRYNQNGSLDTTFGGVNGIVTTEINGKYDQAYNVKIQADGKILVVGSAVGLADTNQDIALLRYNSDGSLDTSFSADGKVTTDFDTNYDKGYSVALQADGKILVTGDSYNPDTNTADIALVRYNTDGSLDTTFSNDGKINAIVGFSNTAGHSVTLQPDGKILVAGSGYSSTSGNKGFVMLRYNTNGSLDTTFSNDGIAFIDNFSTVNASNSITVQADGKILVAGYSGFYPDYDFALVRYNSDGSLDATFDTITSLNGHSQFTEKSSPSIIDYNATIYDAELAASGNYAGASLTLARHNAADSDDLFSGAGIVAGNASGSVVTSGITIGNYSYNSGALVITFNSAATQMLVNQAIRKIAYSNSNELPDASVQIDWIFNDGNSGSQGTGGALSTTGFTTINISNDDDRMYGSAANDIFDGGKGYDTMIGYGGNDTYIIDSIGDVVEETSTIATEIDTVKSSVSYTLGSNVENLVLTGVAPINASGNTLNNTLTGNSYNNKILGAGGNDILNGGMGNDTLQGGVGNDTYMINSSLDRIIEASTISSELDTVKSSISYTLGKNLENLVLTGTASIKGVGNALNNTLSGNGASNQLEGGLGNDVLMAGNGEDILVGGEGTDTFVITSTLGKDKISDFVSGIEDIKFSAAGMVVGDGDAVLEGKLARSASGGFGTSNELVIFTKNIAGSITNINAASTIGSATDNLAIGNKKLFVVDNGLETNIYLFTSADNNASVSSSELKLLVTMYDVNNSTVGDYFLQA